ncbi:MAG: SHOCT domain-containing protein [Candidatus Dormibacteria bacterium]
MFYRYGPGPVGDHWWLMLVLLVLLVAAVVAVGFLIFERSRPVAMAGTPDPAEMILSERLARGEIDEEEYRRRLAALRERFRS